MHNDNTVAARRIRRALYDLGLEPLVGAHWCGYIDGALVFGALSPRQADAFTCALEDLAERLPALASPVPGAGQLRLSLGRVPGRARLRLVASDRPRLSQS